MLASVNDRLKRAEICQSCEHYRKSIRQCNICGCLVSLKITWANTRCPLDKWTEVAPGNDVVSKFQQQVLNVFNKSSKDQNKP